MNRYAATIGKAIQNGHAPGFTSIILFITLCSAQLHGQQPVITSFAPLSGTAGTPVMIYGSGFEPDSNGVTVYFGAVKAEIVATSPNALTVKVPAGAGYQPVSVTAKGLTAYTDRPFAPAFPGVGAAFTSRSFAPKTDLSTGNFPADIAIQDFDGDGKADLVAALNPGSYVTGNASVFRNISSSSNISFPEKKIFYLGLQPDEVCVSDLDGDGKRDVVTGSVSYGNYIYLLRNTGTAGSPNFTVAQTGQTIMPGAHEDIQVADIDGDGKPDLIIAQSAAISVYRNISRPGVIDFGPQVRYSLTNNMAKTLCVGDVDGDGKPEIIFTGFSTNILSVIKNASTPGSISLTRLINFTFPNGGDNAIALQDLDGDRRPDLAIANNYNSSGQVSLFRNQSTADSIRFVPAVNLAVGGNAGALATGDMDGDSNPDLVVTNLSTNRVAVFRNTGNGALQFAPKAEYSTGTSPQHLALGDLDGDGKPEIAVSNYVSATVSILRNQVGEPLVLPAGASPVSGVVSSRVTLDSSVQSYHGALYVPRHYDIEPQSGAANATARVTLYFSQEDFDRFNATAVHGADLPRTPADATGKAALRVFQYHGTSATGLPGTYSGSTVMIDPADTAITWNADAGWWEVSFDVTGFSGFFVSSAGNEALPVQLLRFTAVRQGNKAVLEWHTARETDMRWFELERSDDGRLFVPIDTIAAGRSNYTAFDLPGSLPVCYYRLKMVDRDGSVSYSRVASIRQIADSRFGVFPNPAHGSCTVLCPAGQDGVIELVDASGRVVKTVRVNGSAAQTAVSLTGVLPGIYNVIWKGGGSTVVSRLVVR